MELTPGQIVMDRYRVDRLIGSGGMGSVYDARDRVTSQRVALKVLHAALLRHPVIPKRFVQEATAARALTTPFAVKVEATGNLADGSPFLVMEYLDGVDLGQLVRQAGGTLSVSRVVRLADQIASALEEAHAKGIVHRDLKPENVFVLQTPAGEMVKLVDFGISKILTREDGIRLTQTGTTLGTPQYMSMEQLCGAKDLDGRVDVYALGVMLYEILAGVRPYDGFTYEEVILKVASTTPAPLESLRGDLPAGLVNLVTRAMERDRGARIGSMAEVRLALAELLGQGRPSGAAPRLSTGWPPASPSSHPPKARKNTGIVAVVVVVVALLGVAGFLVLAGAAAGAWFFVGSGTSKDLVQPAPKANGSVPRSHARSQTR